MTVRGQACMEDTQDSAASQSLAACNGHQYHHHQQQQEDQKGQCSYSGSKRSSVSSGSRFQSVLEVTEPEDTVSRSEDSRTAETDDELPLGSEANSLRQDTEAEQGDGFYYSQPPVDKRLLWLRRGGGALPNSGWTSFNSDASNLTSGSSANSVDWLLQERQVDPEEVLCNLGFGSGPMQDTTTMYTRIPVRFLQQQAQDGAQLDDAEVGGQEGSGEGSRRNPSRAAAAWRTARTMSSAMFSLKVLSSLQQSSPLGVLSSVAPTSLHGRSPLSGSSPSLTPPGSGPTRSILHPDNQRALAKQGFYGDNLPEGIDPDTRHRGEDENEGRSKRSAEDRRKMFQKTRSKRQKSLVESGGEDGDHTETVSRDSIMKSVDFSTTTESTDSGELLSSAPTTPGDVFTERVLSPLPGGLMFPGSVTNIEDLYFPERDQHNSSFMESRKKMTQKLMADLDNDDEYVVSPSSSRATSRQPTVEKAFTLTETQTKSLNRDSDDTETPAASRSVESDLSGKSVTIVVSTNGELQKSFPSSTSRIGGMNFLSIVSAAMDKSSDKSSDCGSDYTLVEQQLSTSGSESPRPFNAVGGNDERQNGNNSQDDFADLEEGPVVYHMRSNSQVSPRDENDNFTDTRQSQRGKSFLQHVGSQHYSDDLPRMSSIQSDSSGLGESEVSGENTGQEMTYLKVSSLGSSCESSATQTSTRTITAGNNFQWSHQDSLTQPPPNSLHSELDDNPHFSSSPTNTNTETSAADTGSGYHYVSWCYIPVNSAQSGNTNPCKPAARTTTSSKDFVLGKTRVSLVLRDSDLSASDSDTRKKDKRKSGARLMSNEKPLSEELALAGMRDDLQSSTQRYSVRQTSASSVPKLTLQHPTMDVSSQDGTRSSGDELDDDRGSPFSPWGRDLSKACHRFAPMHEEEGDVESGASLEESSVYSCASTADSISSSISSEVLDCHKLFKLINQPTMFKGRRTHLVQYYPKCHLREWPSLVKKKKLQEETRLVQYAVQKFKTELSIMETAVMVKYQMAFEDMSQDDREDVEELQHLWHEVRRQVMDTEQFLTSRMKAITSGNDCFNSLAAISVLQRMIDILKEQMFQSQISCMQEERGVEETDLRWIGEGRGEWLTYSPFSPDPSPRSASSSWGYLPQMPTMRGRYSSSTSHLSMTSPTSYSDRSIEQLRNTLLSEVRKELRTSLQALQDDLQKRDHEIHQLQEQLMETKPRRPRTSRSRSYYSPRQRNGNRKETDV